MGDENKKRYATQTVEDGGRGIGVEEGRIEGRNFPTSQLRSRVNFLVLVLVSSKYLLLAHRRLIDDGGAVNGSIVMRKGIRMERRKRFKGGM